MTGTRESRATTPERGHIRLVAVDLDGTLLNDSKQVTEQTIAALGGLPARGVRVVIASARPPRSVRHVHAQLGLDTWQINYNGALIWDEASRRAVYHQPMDCELVRRIIDRARSFHDEVIVTGEILDRWYTDRFDETCTTATGLLFRPDVVAAVEEFCNQPVTKLMFLAEPDTISRLTPLVAAEYADVSVVRSDPDLVQVMDARASKAVALRRVAAHYGVPMGQVMAIGDAVNDVPMLEAAGVAIAMDNAAEEVKRVADWVAPSNNDHGVCAALHRYGLCP